MKTKILFLLPMLAILMTSASAYTVGNDVCEGFETQGWEYRFFNTAEINNDVTIFFSNDTGDFLYTNWEIVDSDYNVDIVDSAIHFFEFDGTGELENPYRNRFQISWFNDTPYLIDDISNMNSFSIDFYNVSHSNMKHIYMIIDFSYSNETEDKTYLTRVQNNPVTDIYFLGDGDYQIHGIIDGLCDVRNQTTGELIEEDVSCPNPMPVDSVRLWIYNELSYIYDDWTFEFTIDNLNITYSETELYSPDCAVVLEDMNSLYSGLITKGFVNVTGTILNTQTTLDYAKLLYSRGIYDGNNWLYIADSSSSYMVGVPIGCIEYLSDKSELLISHEINVVGWIGGILDTFPLEHGYPNLLSCDGFSDLGVSTDTPLIKEVPMNIQETTESFGDNYVLSKDIVYNSDLYYYRKYENYNSTHYAQTDMLTNTTTYVGVNETRATDVGDYEIYRALFYPFPVFYIFFSDSPLPNYLIESTEITFVTKGDGFANQCELRNPEFCYTALNPIISYWNIIGDGICGDLESDGYYTWNYDSQCRMNLASISNFAVGSTDISAIADFEDVDLVLNNTHGRINFTSTNLTQSTLDFDSNVEISLRHIGIDSSAMPELNAPAQLIFRNVGFAPPDGFIIYKDGSVCPTSICTRVSSDGETVVVDVTEFSDYDLIDSQGDLNLAALLDAIGGFFVAINETTSLSANAMASANSSDNIATLGGIIILFIIAGSLGAIWYIRR